MVITIPTVYNNHISLNVPTNVDITTAVATYLDTSINHFPISLFIEI